MNVVYLSPGTGGTFYCQNCMRDVALVRALRKHDYKLTMLPVYLPILIDATGLSEDVPVFFGGINVYLQQELSIFRKTPRWLDKFFDMDWMLRKAAKAEGSTEASSLGPMLLSMLKGPQGNQRKELDRMLAWLEEHEKPDVIHLSNSLLTGMAEELKHRFNVPIVCSLQDEENWIDAIPDPHRQACWDTMAECAEYVDAFVSVSDWYAQEMCGRMKLSADKVHTVHLGIELDERDPVDLPNDPPVIGYLSKMCRSLGLGELVDAFITLKQKPGLENIKLRATGGQHGPDLDFVKGLERKLREAGFADDVEFLEGFALEERREFIRSLTTMCVPAAEGEAFGMYILESNCEGVPVVQPNSGGYPEVVGATGGGVIYDLQEAGGLVNALEPLLRDTNAAQELGRAGRARIYEHFGVDRMADDIAKIYERVT